VATPPPPTPLRQMVVSLSQSYYVSSVELTDGRGGEGGEGGAKSYDGKKAWASTNRSIFSGPPPFSLCKVECRGGWRSGGYPYFFNFKEWFHSPLRTVQEIYIERKQINNGLGGEWANGIVLVNNFFERKVLYLENLSRFYTLFFLSLT
jgi:hypothetical protein